MKALTFKRYGKSPEIGFADVPRATPKADELLVQVHAASVNPIDNMIPTGIFKAVVKFELPATLGSDLAGVVVEVGSRVTRFKVGDAVSPTSSTRAPAPSPNMRWSPRVLQR